MDGRGLAGTLADCGSMTRLYQPAKPSQLPLLGTNSGLLCSNSHPSGRNEVVSLQQVESQVRCCKPCQHAAAAITCRARGICACHMDQVGTPHEGLNVFSDMLCCAVLLLLSLSL